MESQEKELRNKRILDLQNEGKSIKQIADEMGLSKGGVHKILASFLLSGESPTKEVVEVKLKGDEEKFDSFVGWKRTNVNEYANEKTGEVIRVAYVKSTSPDGFGYFVKLQNTSGDSTKPVISDSEVSN